LSLGLASTAFAASNVPIEYLRPMKNSVAIGVRMIGGASVTFGGPGLGMIGIPYTMNDTNPDTGNAYRVDYLANGSIPYDDGTVGADSADASSSSPGRPSQTGIPAGSDGRWQTNVTLSSTMGNPDIVVPNGNYLAYDTSQQSTRNWSAKSTSQVYHDTSTGLDYVDMSLYASNGVQDGETAHAKSGISPGIELQLGRVIQRYKRFEWGFNFTFGFAQFNAKNRQTLKADAVKYTDRYQVLNYSENPDGSGAFLTAPGAISTGTDGITPIISNPSFTDLPYTDADGNATDANGNALVFTGAFENTSPLGTGGDYGPVALDSTGAPATPPNPDDPEAPATTNYGQTVDGLIHGYWQVKGVYYLFRLGPMIRVPIGKHFSAAVSIGYIGAWVGSKIRFAETLEIPNITSKAVALPDPANPIIYNPNTQQYQYNNVTDIAKNNQKFLSGAYVDANFEWWLTTRTGFYAGVTYEKLSKYKQGVYGREATVNMTNGLGVRFGIMTRF